MILKMVDFLYELTQTQHLLWLQAGLVFIEVAVNRDEGGYSTLQKTFSGEIPEGATKSTVILNAYRGKTDYQAYN